MSDTDRYRDLRMELAQLALRFRRAASRFPSSFYEFVECDVFWTIEEWQEWISKNRTSAELKRQRWDFFPRGWAQDHDDLLSEKFDFGIERTRDCGVLHSPPATLEASQVELEDLSKNGILILLAIRNVLKNLPKLQKTSSLPTLPDGLHGWLYLVRKTAEVNQGVSLSVEYLLFNVPQNERSQIRALKESIQQKVDEYSPEDSMCYRITPDIFTASSNAISIWLQDKREESIRNIVCKDLEIPVLLSPDNRDESVALLQRTMPVPSLRNPKRKRGRPRMDEKARALDRQIFELKRSGIPTEEVASRFKISIAETNLRSDRERKRRERASKR